MAHARLHIICGNCGNNDLLSYEIDHKGADVGDGTFRPVVYITCRNCGTLHDLSNTIPEKEQ